MDHIFVKINPKEILSKGMFGPGFSLDEMPIHQEREVDAAGNGE